MKYGEGRKQHTRNPAIVERDSEWLALFQSGLSMAEIARRFGFSREFVRQRIATFGLKAKDGQFAAQRKVNRQLRELERKKQVDATHERWAKEAFGLTWTERSAIISEFGPKVLLRWRRARVNHRNAWQLTFLEWLDVWRRSGLWDREGRGRVGLVRHDTTQPFRANNVFVGSLAAHVRRLHRTPEWRADWASKFKAAYVKNF